MPAHVRTTSRLTTALAGPALGSALMAGCGSASQLAGPRGVDLLRIPTPSPLPADFVAGVDNPWLARVPGATAVYDVLDTGTSAGLAEEDASATVEVAAATWSPARSRNGPMSRAVDS